MEHLEVPVGDLLFTARAWGPPDGRAVLLLHGFPQAAAEWDAVGERLGAAGLWAVALDQRGIPPRARPEAVEAYGMRHLVADVLGAADTLVGPGAPFDLVGHDWGAAVAWQVAARAPDRVRSLVAVSVPHPRAMSRAIAVDADQREKSAYMLRWRVPGDGERELLDDDARGLRSALGDGEVPGVDVEAWVRQAREPGVLTAGLNWYRAVSPGETGDAPDVAVPTTMVWPSDDAFIGRRAAEGARRCVSGDYRFVELPGVSHWAPEEAPDLVAAEVVRRCASRR